MIYPSIDSLLKKTDSRYTLVIAAAKRARQIMDGAETKVESKSNKPVTVALEEINQSKIRYEQY